MTLSSILKRKSFWGFSSALLDLFFPPLCKACGTETSLKIFCSDCWGLCRILDPVTRCTHCFDPVDFLGPYCHQCRKRQLFPFQRAYVFENHSPAYLIETHYVEGLASFGVLQWLELDWELPDAIVPMPDENSRKIAEAFASMLDVPLMKALKNNGHYYEGFLESEKTLLLFDFKNSLKKRKKAARALSYSFPYRVQVFSLFA